MTQLKKIKAAVFCCSLGRGPSWEGDVSGVGGILGEEACLGKGLTWKECVSEKEACLGKGVYLRRGTSWGRNLSDA